MTALSRKDRAAGAIIGALIGDALGVGPHWYYDLEEMRKDYGDWIDTYTEPRPDRYHAGLKAGQNSQTGQVVTLLLESVEGRGAYRESDFTRRLDDLLDTLDGTPEGGRYTDAAMRDVWAARKAGRGWETAGGFADTAEAAIRTPVLAALHRNDIAALLPELIANGRLTHRDPFVLARSVAFGLVVFAVINEIPLGAIAETLPRLIRDRGGALSIPVADVLPEWSGPADAEAGFFDALLLPGWCRDAARDPAVRVEPATAVCRLYGLACSLNFLLPAAYYLAARFPGSFETAVLTAINGGGNNMARASLVGALTGAAVGLSGIPERFITGLFDHTRLTHLASRVAGAAG